MGAVPRSSILTHGPLPLYPSGSRRSRSVVEWSAKLEAGDPVLVAETTAYDAGDRLLELARTHYRGDRYRFRATLVRRR